MPLAEQRGGAELALVHLLGGLHDVGIRWSVTFLEEGSLIRKVRELGVNVAVIEAGRLREAGRVVGTVRAIARRVRETGAQAVLSWMGKAHLYGGPAAKLAGVPAVWFQHGLPTGHWMDRLATRVPAAGILTCSRFVAEAQAKLMPRRAMRVVHPGVELERFDPHALPEPAEARRLLGLPGDGPLVGIAGRMQAWKGMHVLIEAMVRVRAAHAGARCLVVGGEHALEPGYEARLRGDVARLGLGGAVIFAGHQTDVPMWMQAMDVVVHASEREPFGMVVVEAMALGKPVVATVPGGPGEVITDGVDGQLVRYGDVEGLAGAVLRYLDEPGFAASCGGAARRRARSFSAQRFAEGVCDAMRELTAGKMER